MKLKYIILLAIIGIASFYLYQDKAIQSKILGKVHQVAPELNKSTLYKWQNEKGEWQVTDKPPGKGITYSSITSQDQINVMPGSSRKEEK